MRETKFKKTDIGYIPSDWNVIQIKALGMFMKGSIDPSSSPTTTFYEYSMPAFDETNKPNIVEGSAINSNRTPISGDVLLINKLNVRQKRIWHVNDAPNNAVCSGEFLPFVSNIVSLDYLKHLLLTDKIVNEWNDNSTGTSNSQKRVTPTYVLNYKLPIPSLKEQIKIAKALGDVDDLISSLTKLIEKKQSIKIATMQQLLTGTKRLNGFYKPWVENCIEDAFTIIGNNCYSRNEMSTSGIVRNVHYGDVLIKFGAIINADSDDLPYLTNKDKAVHPLCDGDIIMADTAEDETCGKACEIRGIGESMVESGLHTIALRPREEYGANFLGYYMNSAAFHNLLLPLMQGTKVTSISKSALMEVRIKTPSDLAEQKAIADILTDMDKEITVLKQKLAKYESIKKGMMQELLTGKIRLV